MSFIRERDTRLLEKAMETRRELFAYALLVSVWGVIIGAFGAALFEFVKLQMEHLAWITPWRAWWVSLVAFVVLGLAGAALLARGLSAGMQNVRQFKIVVPVMAFSDRIEALEIRGYRITEGIRSRLARGGSKDLLESYQRTLTEGERGRPFRGVLFERLSSAVSEELRFSAREWCEFFLSERAEFHGVDYSALAKPAGPCSKVEISGRSGEMIHLPHGCEAKVETGEPDRYGW